MLGYKGAPLAELPLVENPWALGGFLARLKSVLATPVWGAISFEVPTWSKGHLQPTKGTVPDHVLGVNVGYLMLHVYRVTKKAPVAKGL